MVAFGRVPQDWSQVTLGGLAKKIFSGGTPSTAVASFWDGDIPWITSKWLGDRLYLNSGEKEISEAALKKSATKVVPAGNLIFGTRVGVGKVVVNTIDVAINQDLAGIIIDDADILPEFLAFQLGSGDIQKFVEQNKRGATIKGITKSCLQKISLLLPPLAEQKKIAAVLSLVQQAIEYQERLVAVTTELKKALMQKLFTAGIRGEPQKQTEIGVIPQSWDVVPLGSHADFKNGINFTKEQKGNKGILTIDVLNMYGHGCNVSLERLYRVDKKVPTEYVLQNGDLLFVRSSLKQEGVGWTSLYENGDEPVTFCGFIIRVRLKDAGTFKPRFLTYFFHTDKARQTLVSGGAQVAITNINQSTLRNAQVPKPSLEEQENICLAIENVEKKASLHQSRRDVLTALLRTLLHQLMTAQIRVHDVDLSELGLKPDEAELQEAS